MGTQPKRPLLKLYALRARRRMVIGCVSTVIGTCLAGVLIVFSLSFGTALAEMENGELIFVVFACVMLAMGLIIPVAMIGGIAWWRARQLDPPFTALGMKSKFYALTWRRYEGVVAGREVQARIIRGPMLYLEIPTTLNTRFAVGTRTGLGQSLSGAFEKMQIMLDDPDFEHLAASGHHKEWVRDLLVNSDARDAVLRLTQDMTAVDLRTLTVQPGKLMLSLNYIHTDVITPENLQAWYEDMVKVLEEAERQPPPADPDV